MPHVLIPQRAMEEGLVSRSEGGQVNSRGSFAELLSLNGLCFALTGGGAQTASVGPDCQGALSANAKTAPASPPRAAQTPPTPLLADLLWMSLRHGRA